MSVLYRKSWQDIRRRWARSLFTVITIAAAVASLGLFALPPLMDRAMAARIADDRLHDIRINTEDLILDDGDAAALRALPGVESIELRASYYTELRIGDRREDALLIGVSDFENQHVNVISIENGAAPTERQALTDTQNARSGRLKATAGDNVQVEDSSGALQFVGISGAGRTLQYSQIATDGTPVLYAPQAEVNKLAGTKGINAIEVQVTDPDQAKEIMASLQTWLTDHHPEVVFTNLPDVRAPGTWPGQDIFDNFSTLFYVGAFLALISAVALISNTMTTMVAEQRREIAIMKAIGGRRRQIAFSFLRTVALLAIAGSLLGVALGTPFANLLARFVGSEFLGVVPDWGIAWVVVLISLAVGIVGTTLAAVPALVRSARTPVYEGLSAASATISGQAVSALRLLPLPLAGRVGLRNIMRRKTRALGTILQVGLAVGVALGFLALGVTVGNVTADTWDTMSWDVIVAQNSTVPLDPRAGALPEDLDGTAVAQPMLYNNLQVGDTQYESWGIRPHVPLYSPNIESGRWLEPADSDNRARVAVIGHALAGSSGVGVGDTLQVLSARGRVELTIVGIDGTLMNNGTTLFLPLETFQEILGRTDANAYWLVSASQDVAAIDRLAAQAEDTLGAAGYRVATEIHYVEKEANLDSNRTLVGVLAAMGIPIVAIGLIGLVNMMTMNIIERTREIGILRCIGAGSRDISRIFRAEALVIAGLGWLLAVPVGWLIGKTLVLIVAALFDFGSLPYAFPGWYPPIALGATLALSWLVVIPPLRRASGLRPGDALRYE